MRLDADYQGRTSSTILAEPTGFSGPPEDWPNREWSRVLRVDNRRWHVQETGEGSRMLLIHGTGASTHSWRSLMPLLAKHHHVVAMDLPGHAFTERRSGERLSLAIMAEAVSCLLDDLGFEPDYIVGHSAGGAVGLRMALDGSANPRRFIGLNAALLPFGGIWQPLANPLARICASVSLVPRFLSAAARDPNAVQRLLESTGSVIDEEGLQIYRRLMSSERHVASVLSMMANWDLNRFLQQLPGLGCQLSLVVANNDLAVKPEQAERVREISPETEIVRLEACGHLAHEEAPAAVAAVIERLCAAGGRTDV